MKAALLNIDGGKQRCARDHAPPCNLLEKPYHEHFVFLEQSVQLQQFLGDSFKLQQFVRSCEQFLDCPPE